MTTDTQPTPTPPDQDTPAIRDRIRELRRVPAGQLTPHPRNWRRHPPGQRRALASVLAEIGWADALIARDTPDGLQLIDGHLRADLSPTETVPVLVLDVDEAEADRLLASLDPLAAMADTDAEALRALLDDVKLADDGLLGMLEALAAPPAPRTGRTDPDAVPPPPAEPTSRHGDVWQLGEHRLLCGDATAPDTPARLGIGGE